MSADATATASVSSDAPDAPDAAPARQAPTHSAPTHPPRARPGNAETVIAVRNVSVRYQVTPPDSEHRSDLVSRFLRPKAPFHALRDVDLDIARGEMFYFVGRNGAGKTTLLKVLAQTLIPDSGTVTYRGEVTSFLSMGLGFQPELTGNQNLRLALTLMGVRPGEIPELREQINDFTQLGAFMAMPVKTYSAGMKARLGFAIATSLKPDILVMDEVLNTGDAQFRVAAKKRLEGMMSHARAIIIATHNLSQAAEGGHRAAWIEAGRVRSVGVGRDVVKEYQAFIAEVQADPFYDLRAQKGRFEGQAEAPLP